MKTPAALYREKEQEIIRLMNEVNRDIRSNYTRLYELIRQHIDQITVDGKIQAGQIPAFLGRPGTPTGFLGRTIAANSEDLERIMTGGIDNIVETVIDYNNHFLLAVGGPTITGTNLEKIKKAVRHQFRKPSNFVFNLKDSVWNLNSMKLNHLRSIVRSGVAQGKSSYKIATKIEKYLVKTKAYTKKPEPVGRGVYRNARQNARRVTRTAMAEAARLTDIEFAKKTKSINGLQWMLSKAHPCCDECDDLAAADKYGLGKGAYPVDKFPPLPHPHCLCWRKFHTVEERKAA